MKKRLGKKSSMRKSARFVGADKVRACFCVNASHDISMVVWVD